MAERASLIAIPW
jgi:peptide/nickel transport system substrate-binding protein